MTETTQGVSRSPLKCDMSSVGAMYSQFLFIVQLSIIMGRVDVNALGIFFVT